MIKKLINILQSDKFLKLNYIIFILIWLIIIFIGSYLNGVELGDGDNYIGSFQSYMSIGHNKSVIQGTSILFNLMLLSIFKITKSIYLSFFILHFFSWLFVIIFTYTILNKNVIKKDIYFYITASIIILFLINEKYFLKASNDYFLVVFLLLTLNKILKLKRDTKTIDYILIGLFLGIALLIRSTPILLLPILFFKLYFNYLKFDNYSNQIKKTLFIPLFCLIIIIPFNYYSIVEKGKLSFEDKNPKEHISNWIQRDYLGLKKIQKNPLSRSREIIWTKTPFTEVDTYLIKNGTNSLPRTTLEFLIKDPVLLIENAIVNIVNVLFVYFKYWGILFLMPFIFLIKKRKIKENLIDETNHPILLFLIFTITISTVCLTLIEFRWFMGYEILIPIAIIGYINKNQNKAHKNMLFSISLITIILFNLRLVVPIFTYLIQ